MNKKLFVVYDLLSSIIVVSSLDYWWDYLHLLIIVDGKIEKTLLISARDQVLNEDHEKIFR